MPPCPMAKHRFNIKFFFADVSVKYYEVISCPMAKHRFNIKFFLLMYL